MSARRVSLRLAWRSMRRSHRRSFILVLSLTFPLTIAVGLATLQATSTLSPETRVAALVGQSQSIVHNGALVRELGAERAAAEGAARLNQDVGRDVGARLEVSGFLPVSVNGRQVDSFGYGLDLDDPIHFGRFHLLDGVPPRAEGEVALSQAVAGRLGVQVGGQVVLGPTSEPAAVTGIVAITTDTLRKFVVTIPTTALRTTPGEAPPGAEPAADRGSTVLTWHVAQRLDAESLQAGGNGWSVDDRQKAFNLAEDFGAPTDQVTAWILGITVLVVVELGLIMGAVYAIVVRSNRRELGLLASAGAGPKVRRAVITYQGILAGVISVVVAVGLGVGTAYLIAPYAAARSFQIWETFQISPVALIATALLGIGTPMVAARIAAHGVSRDIVAALRDLPEAAGGGGKRGALLASGALSMGATMLAIGGFLSSPMLVLLGALSLVTGAGLLLRAALPVVGARATRLRVLHRLGLRVAARSAPRAAALATVVASLTALAGLVLAAMGGLTADVNRTYVPRTPNGSAFVYTTRMPSAATVAAVADAIGNDNHLVSVGLASPPRPDNLAATGSPLTYWGDFQVRNPVTDCLETDGNRTPEECVQAQGFPALVTPVMAVRPDDLAAMIGRVPTSEELDAFTAGSALVLDDRLSRNGTITAEAPGANGRTGAITRELPALVVRDRSPYASLPFVLVGAAGLERIGAIIQPNSAFFYTTGAGIAEDQEDRARNLLAEDIGAGYFSFEVERGPAAGRILLATTLASIGLLVLAAATLAFITVSLATQDMRPDLAALAAAGADRRFRSLLSGSHAGQVTLVGVAIGATVTAIGTPALLSTMEVSWSFWPWLGVAVAGAGAVGAAVFAGWLSGSRIATSIRRA